MPSYTVTLEVRETRYVTLELLDVEAESKEQAIDVARRTYKDTGRMQFELQGEDIESDEVTDFHAEEEKDD